MKNHLTKLMLLFFLSIVFACSKEEETVLIQKQNIDNKHSGVHMAPWTLSMDWRFSHGTCATGPGVCFKDGDGDIVIGWGSVFNNGGIISSAEQLHKAFKVLMDGNEDKDNGVIAFRVERDQLHMVFSRSLEEPDFILKEDVVLRKKLSIHLGMDEIIIPAGVYKVDRSNFEHGEVKVPFKGKEITLDYHEDYGTIHAKDYPVGGKVTLESFLEDLNITKNDLKRYQIVEAKFTGVAYTEHLVNNKLIYVWHKYNNEPVSVFEGVLNDGKPVSLQRIHWCGNEFGGFSSFDFFWAFIDLGCWWCD
ncbi:hypothetical protein ACSTS3_05725 [Aquimarina muelleri]|uniref:hypothetical protein n=1 Tax=Aquimarina muelleri TaxID=279356 RepID=UPI003F688CE6